MKVPRYGSASAHVSRWAIGVCKSYRVYPNSSVGEVVPSCGVPDRKIHTFKQSARKKGHRPSQGGFLYLVLFFLL